MVSKVSFLSKPEIPDGKCQKIPCMDTPPDTFVSNAQKWSKLTSQTVETDHLPTGNQGFSVNPEPELTEMTSEMTPYGPSISHLETRNTHFSPRNGVQNDEDGSSKTSEIDLKLGSDQ